MREIRSHLDQTYVTWIGGLDDDQPFYYRVQSPVVVAEFDHHAGIWLTNPFPARFHIHTTLRLPNGHDYGRLLWNADATMSSTGDRQDGSTPRGNIA
jgi:hypothetical protein